MACARGALTPIRHGRSQRLQVRSQKTERKSCSVLKRNVVAVLDFQFQMLWWTHFPNRLLRVEVARL